MSLIENKTNKLEGLVRPNIRALQPYSSARDEFETDTDTPGARLVFLDANENSLGGPLGEALHRYPDPHQRELKRRLALREGLEPGQIFLGNGSDEAIDLLLRAFCEPGRDNIVLLPPTYGMYAVQTRIQGAELRQAPLRADFSPDAGAVQAATDAQSRLIFLCSPNNPTGQRLPDAFVRETLETFPGLVVVDEAYGDFAAAPSLSGWLAEYPNLVVLKTFSKAWGLAGLRVGMAFAHPFVTGILTKIKYPYNIGATTQQLVLDALEQSAQVQRKVAVLLAERQRLAERLAQFSGVEQVFPSDANFLLVKVLDADRTYRYLCENGIVVRNRTRELHCHNCLRITVGTPEENDRLLEVLRSGVAPGRGFHDPVPA